MSTQLEQPARVDELSEQDEFLAAESLLADRAEVKRDRSKPSVGRLERLDLYVWVLLFGLGTLFGSQFLPVIESWLAR